MSKIEWTPVINTSEGSANIEYYHSNKIGTNLVHVELRLKNIQFNSGKPGYFHINLPISPNIEKQASLLNAFNYSTLTNVFSYIDSNCIIILCSEHEIDASVMINGIYRIN